MGPVADQVLKQFAANFAAGAGVQAHGRAGSDAPAAGAAAAPRRRTEPPKPAQLNGLALVWAVVKGWLRSLFAAQGGHEPRSARSSIADLQQAAGARRLHRRAAASRRRCC